MWSISSFGFGTSSKGLEFISQGMVVEGPTVGSVLEGPAEVLTVPLLDLRGTRRDLRRRGSTMSWVAADNSASSQSSRSHRRRKELKSLGFRYRVSLRFFWLIVCDIVVAISATGLISRWPLNERQEVKEALSLRQGMDIGSMVLDGV